MKIFLLPITSIFIVMLCGCSAGKMAKIDAAREGQRQEFLDAKFKDLQNTCDRFGFTRGTDGFANCMQKAESQWNENYDRSKRESQCRFAQSAEYFKPTLGGFYESNKNASIVFDNCMAR
jgi:hypothetical protein